MLKVASINFKTSPNKEELLIRICTLITDAVTIHQAKLICLPECFTGLYGVEYFKDNAEVIESSNTGSLLLKELAEKHSVYIVGGIIEDDVSTKKLYNTMVCYDPSGKLITKYRKIHLSCVSVGKDNTSEGSILSAGSDLSWFDIPETETESWRICIACCFDLRFQTLSNLYCTPKHEGGLGADVLLYPSAWLNSTGELGHWRTLLSARALDGQVFVLGANQAKNVDFADDILKPVALLYGKSCVVGPMGEVISICADDTNDGIVVAEITKDYLDEVRGKRINLSAAKKSKEFYEGLLEKAKTDKS